MLLSRLNSFQLNRIPLDPLAWPTYDAGYIYKPATNVVAGCFGYIKDFFFNIAAYVIPTASATPVNENLSSAN